MSAPEPSEAWRRCALLLSLLCAMVFASPYFPKLGNPNEGARVYMVAALVDDGSFSINDVVKRWGYVDDKSVVEGRLYSSKAPLMSLIGVPVYALVRPLSGPLDREALTRVLRVGANALPCFALVLLLSRRLWRRTRDPYVGELSLAGLVVGTHVLAYAIVFSGHAIAALATALMLLLVLDLRDARASKEAGRPRDLALLGFLGALATGVEYPAVLAAAPLVVVGLLQARTARAVLFLAAGALLPVVATAWAHTAMFGAPWRTGYSFLENTHYRALHGHDFFGVGAPKLEPLLASLFGQEVGLFFYAPVLAVGLVVTVRDLVRGGERRSVDLAVVVATVLLCLFIAGHRGWRGGWVVGPRYISPLTGLLLVPAAFAFDALAQRRPVLARTSLALLVCLGVAHSGLSSVFYPHLHDGLRNPVHELVLPLLTRGLSPTTPALWLGLSAEVACGVLVFVLVLPLLVVVMRRDVHGHAAALALGSGLAALLVVVSGPLLPATPPDACALLVRQQRALWRPLEGNPWTSANGVARHPRRAFALDDPKTGFDALRREGCGPELP